MRHRLFLVGFAGLLSVGLVTARAVTVDAPVADAAMRGDAEAVRTLLREGADVNAAQADGMTALHWTAERGDVDTMSVVLYAGAAVDPLTRLGRYTPLHLASTRGHAAAVTRLLAAGCKADALTTTGVLPIHLAAQAGSADAVKALLSAGADANAIDRTHGRSPLVFAVSRNRIAAMTLLIEMGADIGQATNVIDYAQRSRTDASDRQTRSRIMAATTGRA
ncbi:MAG TPA: ankyrin repeat domain-containing protein, partial [Vicinamibacterales bacterium]|nr:ankyrin repeat domain-containing protein [Vicinamibacterales bacterium]